MTRTDIAVHKSKGCIYPKIIFHCPRIPPSIVPVLQKYGDVTTYRFTRPLVKVKSKEVEILTVIGGNRLQVFFKSHMSTKDIEESLKK